MNPQPLELPAIDAVYGWSTKELSELKATLPISASGDMLFEEWARAGKMYRAMQRERNSWRDVAIGMAEDLRALARTYTAQTARLAGFVEPAIQGQTGKGETE